MKQQYNSTSNGGLRIFNILGFLFAVILTVGFFKKSGTDFTSESSAYEMDGTSLKSKIADMYEDEKVHTPKIRSNTKSYATDHYKNEVRVSKVNPASVSIETWINEFDEFAKEQALEHGIPAGISLAMGITKLEAGIPIQSEDDYIRAVVEPLTHLKKNAPYHDRSNYFKYAANSDRWADGLGASGRFSAASLKDLVARYRLDIFDRQVRDDIVHAPSNAKAPTVERKVEYIANEATENRRSEQYEVRHAVSQEEKAAKWASEYDEVVGHEVAKEVARKKLKSGSYITEEDMQALIEETNAETDAALENKAMFMGRKINKNHAKAKDAQDITNPKNSQARGEKYLEYLRKKKQG